MNAAIDNGTLDRQARVEFARALQEAEARLEEHADDPSEAKQKLWEEAERAVRKHGLAVGGEVAKAVERERTQRTARRTIDLEEAEAQLRLPPERTDYTLAAYQSEPKTAREERVAQMQRVKHKTLLVAAYKTGKTTLCANLIRSLTEGDQFLGRFAVKQTEGRVGVWNAEMESDDYEEYLLDAGVKRANRVAIWNLRGYRLPLLSDAGAERAVEWLASNEVTYWIVDPWARLCQWSGASENAGDEVGPLLQRIDEVASDAGVSEVLIVHHAGHLRGRPRGATQLPDWADGIWSYHRDEDDDKRYLKVDGRKVDLPQGLVEIGEDGRAIYRQVTRRAVKQQEHVDALVAYVAENPGCLISEAKDALGVGNAAKDHAARKAVQMGLVRREDDPDDKRRKLLFLGDASGGLEV